MRQSLGDIPELSNSRTGGGLVRIPVEQDVPFTPRVRALVDTAEFQRLGQITQLGLTSRVYPGATHTRFEHALGVFQNTIRYLRQLSQDERFCATVDAHTAEVLLAASLLHDLGHWPFCHPIEDLALPELPTHEEFAREFLADGRELAEVLKREWNVEPGEVLDVLVASTDRPRRLASQAASRALSWTGERNLQPQARPERPHAGGCQPPGIAGSPRLRLVRSILSGPIDVDKMDYLDRDSLHAGVPYGRNFDRNRLIQSLLVNAEGDGLAVSYKGKTAAELMVFARYVMFSEVYWHHAVRSATSMFARAFYAFRERLDLRQFFQNSESKVIDEMRSFALGTECEPLVEGIFGPKRRLYKRVGEYSFYQTPDIYEQLARRPYWFLVRTARELARSLSRSLGEPIAATDVLIDAPPPHREIEFNVDIYFPKEDVYRPLHAVSPVVEALVRTQFDDYVKRVRVFAHPRCAGRLVEITNLTDCLKEAMTRAEEDKSAAWT